MENEDITEAEERDGSGYLEGVDIKVKGFEAEQFNSISALPQCTVLSQGLLQVRRSGGEK